MRNTLFFDKIHKNYLRDLGSLNWPALFPDKIAKNFALAFDARINSLNLLYYENKNMKLKI